jgi:translation initiation factor IF-2
MTQKEPILRERPPIVAVVGHIDHGKSTLLDYIRKSNTTVGEAGGITQHLSAYEAIHKTQAGVERKITFLDTPGHEAFRAMRSRGLNVADVAILVVSAEDGVKQQTIEAIQLIGEAKIPFIVALTKIDKPGANIEKAKMSLLEHNVFLEGLGGEVPFVGVSSKSGEGIPELLELIVLAAELEGLSADLLAPGSGLVIEAHVDPKRGNTATLIVHDGVVESGEYVVCGESMAPVRIMENFLGKNIKEALPGTPMRIVGFSTLPEVGTPWKTVETKKDAEVEVAAARQSRATEAHSPLSTSTDTQEHARPILPLVIKTDFAGTGDAVLHEIAKLPEDHRLEVRVVGRGAGAISEGDVRMAGATQPAGIIVGFNVKVEREARDLAERLNVAIATFDIIYELTAWLQGEIAKRRPLENTDERTGYAKILKVFSNQQGRVVLGARMEEGTLFDRKEIKLKRGDLEIGRGEILSLQTQKTAVKKIEKGSEFGAMVRLSADPAPGDHIEGFEVVLK